MLQQFKTLGLLKLISNFDIEIHRQPIVYTLSKYRPAYPHAPDSNEIR